jgi:GMP synthase-like glutamine amidotransferase
MRAQVWRHHREDHGGLVSDALRRHGVEVEEQLVGPYAPPSSGDAGDFLVILGSSESVYDPTVSWLEREMTELRSRSDRGVRVLGICFGAQMLCALHGGRVAKAPVGELGWYEVRAETPAIPPGPWFQYHYDRCELPPHAEVVALNDQAVQAFTIGRHVGVQFHPEVEASQLRDWFAEDAEALRSGADIESFIRHAERHSDALRANADQLVQFYLSL